MELTQVNAMFGHTSEESAYVVADYPYGYRVRTQIRYWLETTSRGDRLCSQTLNPKTERWNKPKKSTYSAVGCMYRDEADHVQWFGIGHHSAPDVVAEFLGIVREHLSESQKDRAAEILGVQKAYEGVTFSIHEGAQTPEEIREQAQIQAVINRRAARATESARETFGTE
jgi:hypothetical protein